MHRQSAEMFIDAGVRVIWRDDVDPHGTAPLWASVWCAAVDPRQTQTDAHQQVVIELGGPPQRSAALGANPRKGILM